MAEAGAGDEGTRDEQVMATRLMPTEAGALKKGMIAIMKGYPAKIMEINTSKTGKHGHAKCNITGVCILTNRKLNEIFPAHARMMLADTTRNDYTFSHIEGDTVHMFTETMDTISLQCDTEEQRDFLDKIQAEADRIEKAGGDQEVVVTVLTAPMFLNEKDEIEKRVISAVKTQKASA